MRVPLDQPERGRIHQVHVAGDQFAKGSVRSGLDVFGEQVLAVRHVQSAVKAAKEANRTKNQTGNGKIQLDSAQFHRDIAAGSPFANKHFLSDFVFSGF
jgi:hypothetical protein